MAFVVQPRVVARSLRRLREQKTHSLFAGYLHLQRRTTELRRLQDLSPDFLGFYKEFFEVAHAPLGTPYIKPFTEQQPSTRNLWLNENVAGSYAPSSLRPDQPFRRVVDIVDGRYSLPGDHAQRAFVHLLYSIPVNVSDLSVFLYRDYGFRFAPRIEELVDVFAFEFGYTSELNGHPSDEFSTLFTLGLASAWEDDWLEIA